MNGLNLRSAATVVAAALAAIAVAATTSVTAAAAVPDPGPTTSATPVAVAPISSNPPLRRIGSQLVRGDNFTGGGVEAPCWIPELVAVGVA